MSDFQHSGQSWASQGHLKTDNEGIARHVYPCGCTTGGGGTERSPITIKYCAVHSKAHALRNVLGDLLNTLPNYVSTDTRSRLAWHEAQRVFGNLTSSPASPITKR